MKFIVFLVDSVVGQVHAHHGQILDVSMVNMQWKGGVTCLDGLTYSSVHIRTSPSLNKNILRGNPCEESRESRQAT